MSPNFSQSTQQVHQQVSSSNTEYIQAFMLIPGTCMTVLLTKHTHPHSWGTTVTMRKMR